MTLLISAVVTFIILLIFVAMAIFAYGLMHWVWLEYKRKRPGGSRLKPKSNLNSKRF